MSRRTRRTSTKPLTTKQPRKKRRGTPTTGTPTTGRPRRGRPRRGRSRGAGGTRTSGVQRSRPVGGSAAGDRRHGLSPPDADPGAGDPVRADGPRRAGHGADRHRQDRELHPAAARHPLRFPSTRAYAAQPDPGADARTGAAGGGEFRPVRQIPETDARADHRRREHVGSEGHPEPRRRRADRDTGPAARHVRSRHRSCCPTPACW